MRTLENSTIWLGERKVLSALLEHPYTDPYWLGEYLGSRSYTTAALQSLKRRGYAQGFPFSRESLKLKRVWTVTPQGVQALAELRGIQYAALARQFAYERGRMAWIVLAMERVTRLRWWMKNLEGFNPPDVGRRMALALKPVALSSPPSWKWQVLSWDEEIQIQGKVEDDNVRVRFDAAATLSHSENGRWLHLLIQFDDPNLPAKAQRERFTRWLLLQKDPRYVDAEGHLRLPTLALIVHNDYRLNDYKRLIREIALSRGLAVPSIYLALDEQVKATRGNPAQPIWHDINRLSDGILLAHEDGRSGEPPERTWRKMIARLKLHQPICIEPARESGPVGIYLDDHAARALTLMDTDHKLVQLIGAHPLLCAKELERLTNHYQSQISSSLKRLLNMGLVERKMVPSPKLMMEPAEIETDKRKIRRKRETRYYIATERAEQYLAAVDGFAMALARYRYVKLWSPEQTKRLVRDWSHTRLGNMLFIKLISAVRARGWELDWLAETESRLYFSVNGKRRAFLPDGHGVLRIEDARLHFIIEIDIARSNAEKIRRKIARYYASAVQRILLENPDESIRILIITHSLERMNHLLKIVRELEAELDSTGSILRRDAPILLGQRQMIVNPRETIDRPNWIDMDGQRVYCFPQFEPPRLPETTRAGQIIYKSC